MEIPVVQMKLKTNGKGLKVMSLVESPAIQVDWVKFNKEKDRVQLAIQDEEQGIIFGPALIPDLPIYRNFNGKELYLTIDKETIKEVAIQASKDKVFNNFDINHDGNLLNGVTMFEVVVTDKNRFPKAVGFEDLPEGTMFITSKVNDKAVLDRIKSGELRGYSIDALFDFETAEMLDEKVIESEIKEILASI